MREVPPGAWRLALSVKSAAVWMPQTGAAPDIRP